MAAACSFETRAIDHLRRSSDRYQSGSTFLIAG